MDDRYNNFSESKFVVDSFSPGTNPSDDEKEIGEGIQKALSHKNPVVSIQHLLGLQATILAFMQRKALGSIGFVKLLLCIQIVLLAYIAYKLT